MCNNPNHLPAVNRAKSVAIALIVFSIINLTNCLSLGNPAFWWGGAIVGPLANFIAGVLGTIATSQTLCCLSQNGADSQYAPPPNPPSHLSHT